MKFLIYIGIIIYLTLTYTVAPFVGIEQVGTASSIILVGVFIYRVLQTKGNSFPRSNFKAEYHVLSVCMLIIFSYIISGNYQEITIPLFFLVIPIIVSMLCQIQNTSIKEGVVNIILFVFFAECGLAIYERIFEINLFPYSSTDTPNINFESWMFRSTAIFGHPLNNAVCVSTILGFIICGKFNNKFKLLCFILGLSALLCFNARGAILVECLIGLLFVVMIVIEGRKGSLWILFSSLIAFGFIFYIVLTTSFGGRLANESELLDGSAQTRLDVYNAFNYINAEDLIWGNPDNYIRITKLLINAGGIENSFIVIIINYGIVLACLLFIVLFILVKTRIKHYALLAKCILLVSFVLIGSLNNSLAGQTPWVMFLLCSSVFDSRSRTDLSSRKFSLV